MNAPRSKPTSKGEWKRATFGLYQAHVRALDEIVFKIRQATDVPIERSAIIRAMIEAVVESGIDLTSATSEDDIRSALAAALRGGGSGAPAPGAAKAKGGRK